MNKVCVFSAEKKCFVHYKRRKKPEANRQKMQKLRIIFPILDVIWCFTLVSGSIGFDSFETGIYLASININILNMCLAFIFPCLVFVCCVRLNSHCWPHKRFINWPLLLLPLFFAILHSFILGILYTKFDLIIETNWIKMLHCICMRTFSTSNKIDYDVA